VCAGQRYNASARLPSLSSKDSERLPSINRRIVIKSSRSFSFTREVTWSPFTSRLSSALACVSRPSTSALGTKAEVSFARYEELIWWLKDRREMIYNSYYTMNKLQIVLKKI